MLTKVCIQRLCFRAALLLPAIVAHPAAGQDSHHSAGRLVTETFWSQALGIRKRAIVWLPPSYATERQRRFSVAYYLHGAWGSETDWSRKGNLGAIFDSLVVGGMAEMIVVMPDGDDGWYTTWNFLGDWPGCRRNSPRPDEPVDQYCVPWPHYDDYIARDLVSYIDKRFRTRNDAAHRGIAGLSMGGYGAVSLALRYPDVFSSAASHSGIVAPMLGTQPVTDSTSQSPHDVAEVRARYPANLWALMAPAFGKDLPAWRSRDPLHLAQQLRTKPGTALPAIFLDCGKDDPYAGQSRYLAREATAAGLVVSYNEWPGAHDWQYWRAHLPQSANWLASRIATP